MNCYIYNIYEIFILFYYYYYILREEVKCLIQSVGPLKNDQANERLRPGHNILVCFKDRESKIYIIYYYTQEAGSSRWIDNQIDQRPISSVLLRINMGLGAQDLQKSRYKIYIFQLSSQNQLCSFSLTKLLNNTYPQSETREREREREKTAERRKIRKREKVDNQNPLSEFFSNPRISMAESASSTRKSNPLNEVLTVMDMRVVQHLMQLSDEDNSMKRDTDEEVDQPRSVRGHHETTTAMAKIEEIFGKEDAYRPKKRRYRSLVSIYTATKPMNINAS